MITLTRPQDGVRCVCLAGWTPRLEPAEGVWRGSQRTVTRWHFGKLHNFPYGPVLHNLLYGPRDYIEVPIHNYVEGPRSATTTYLVAEVAFSPLG